MGKQLKKIKQIQTHLAEIMINQNELIEMGKKEKNQELKSLLLDYAIECGNANIKLIENLKLTLQNQTQLDFDDIEFRHLMKGFDKDGDKK